MSPFLSFFFFLLSYDPGDPGDVVTVTFFILYSIHLQGVE